MRRSVRCGVAIATLAFGALISAAPASAQMTRVMRGIAGTGLNDHYGFGIGGSLGGEFPFIRGRPFFVGARAVYHFGNETDLPQLAAPGVPTPTGTLRQFHWGIEIGSTWVEAPVLIRTVGGVGLARLNATVTEGEASITGGTNKLQYGPGLLVALPSDSGRFIGIEMRWVKVVDIEDSFAIYATIGKKLF